MNTVFSYIVQTRLSHENENVATEALAFILRSSEGARRGLMELLRGIAPELPDLHFRTQQTKEGMRPDMCGSEYQLPSIPRVFLENKFWAGLTENQPVAYLEQLAERPRPGVLLVVVPAARQETVWRELGRRLKDASVLVIDQDPPASLFRVAETSRGPFLALTSWSRLLRAIEGEVGGEPQVLNDLVQLRALCDAADRHAFVPFSSAELTDQRLPAFILQLNAIVQGAVDLGVSEGVLSIDGLRPTSSWERTGRYIRFTAASGVGAWIGTDFRLWREHGGTPLWLTFPGTDFGRAPKVRTLLEPWAAHKGVTAVMDPEGFSLGIELPAGEEMDRVIRSVVDRLRELAQELEGWGTKQG